MADPFDEAIMQRYSIMQSGASNFDLEVDESGMTVYVPQQADMLMGVAEEQGPQPFAGAEDQLDPFATTGPVEKMGVGEFLQQTGQTMAGAAGGTLATALGTAGDIAGIIKGLTDMAGAEEGQRFATFLQGLSDVSGVIGSERTIQIFEEGVQGLPISDEAKQDIFAGSKFIGEVAGIPVGGGAMVSGARRYAAGAPARIAERGTGMTLQSGFDPMAAVDEAIVGVRSLVRPTDTEPGIIAFHGSPYDFDEFRLEKIGTGEGQQAYGYGLYFTDSEDIAKFYRDSLAGMDVEYKGNRVKVNMSDDPSVPEPDFEEAAALYIGNLPKDRQLDELNQTIERYSANADNPDMDEQARQTFAQMRDAHIAVKENIDSLKPISAGKLYKVGIVPKRKDLLDWDGLLEDQEQLLSKFESMELPDMPGTTGADVLEYAYEAAGSAGMNPTGRDLYNALIEFDLAPEEASKVLNEAGIPGLMYRAQGSRSPQVKDSAAKRNYVIFDDKIIDVMKKYGIVGSVAVSSVAATQGESDQGEMQ